jgi:two-component SAPR family response regulator
MSADVARLSGRRILILEDEAMVSLLLEDMIEDFGAELAGSFSRLERALAAMENGLQVDVALLDVNVAGERSFPLAAVLTGKSVPFVFTTGYDRSGLPAEWRDAPSLRKPFLQDDVRRALERALGLESGVA